MCYKITVYYLVPTSKSRSIIIKGAGHFTPGEAPDEIKSAIWSWWQSLQEQVWELKLLDEKDVRYRDPGVWESRDLQEEIRSFVKSLPAVERKPDSMSQEAYFYGFRNFAHFHGALHIDIRLPKSKQEEALGTGKALEHHYAP